MRAALLLLCLLIGREASAQPTHFRNGNEFFAWCGGQNTYVVQCDWYGAGVIDGLRMPKPAAERYICLPASGPTYRQLIDVVIEYMRRTPEERHWDTVLHFNNALVRAFPCPR